MLHSVGNKENMAQYQCYTHIIT